MSYAKYKNLGGQKTTESFNDFAITEISSQQHKNSILSSNKLCVIDVYGNFCGPCRAVAPKFAQLAKKYNKENICALVKKTLNLNLIVRLTLVKNQHHL